MNNYNGHDPYPSIWKRIRWRNVATAVAVVAALALLTGSAFDSSTSQLPDLSQESSPAPVPVEREPSAVPLEGDQADHEEKKRRLSKRKQSSAKARSKRRKHRSRKRKAKRLKGSTLTVPREVIPIPSQPVPLRHPSPPPTTPPSPGEFGVG